LKGGEAIKRKKKKERKKKMFPARRAIISQVKNMAFAQKNRLASATARRNYGDKPDMNPRTADPLIARGSNTNLFLALAGLGALGGAYYYYKHHNEHHPGERKLQK